MTIFMKIINKEIPTKLVFEDDFCIAFHDINPQAPIHVLLVPKKPIESLASMTKDDQHLVGHLMLKVGEIARSLGIEEKGYRVITNIGDEGGQSVRHLHFHIVGGRQMGGF